MPLSRIMIVDHIARITLENPPANVLTVVLLEELEEIFKEVEQDPTVRAVILTGSGRFFCAGADIHELTQLNSAQRGMEFSMRGQRIFDRIERCSKPVLAAINGTCVGGGLELALACHIRVAAAGAMVGLPEIKLGLIPGFGGTQRLPRIVGPSKATEMILTGESISADEALKIGLVNRVLSASHMMSQTEDLAGLIASRGTTAVQAALHAISGGVNILFAEGLTREAELFGQLCVSPDKQKATQAFLERRGSKSTEMEGAKPAGRSS